MRIILPAIGTAGDVNPMIALGMALHMRGHQAIIITNSYFKEAVERTGLEFLPLGTTDQFDALLRNPDLWHPRKGFIVVAKHAILPATRPLYELLSGFDPTNTVVVAPGVCFGARIAQEKRGMPLISVYLQPAALVSTHSAPILGGLAMPDSLSPTIKKLVFNLMDAVTIDPLLAGPVNAFRAELGLPSVRHVWTRWMHSPERVIALFPEWYAPCQPDWPANTRLTGFVRYDAGSPDTPPDPDVEAFLNAGEPPIVFTPGSGMQHARQFFEVSVEAATALGKRALLITQHPGQVPDNLPASIRHANYIPFSQVFPRAAAVVHHGGIGTMAQTLAAGVPHLVVPFAHDQPDNAARLERLGISKTIQPGAYKKPAVIEKLGYLLNSESVRQRCMSYSKLVDFEAALDQTCRLIEQRTL